MPSIDSIDAIDAVDVNDTFPLHTQVFVEGAPFCSVGRFMPFLKWQG
jgi:hypothetical protein